jgi:putative addiction module component (TIGR02574 family)
MACGNWPEPFLALAPGTDVLRPPSDGRLGRMKSIPVADLLELPVAERLRIVELLWDSIAAVPEAVPIPAELKDELNRRLVEFEADPAAGSPWDEVRSRILQGAWRTG